MEAVRQARHKQEFQEDYTAANEQRLVKEWRRKSQGEGTLRRAARLGPGDKEATTIYSNCTTETQLVKEGYPFLVK